MLGRRRRLEAQMLQGDSRSLPPGSSSSPGGGGGGETERESWEAMGHVAVVMEREGMRRRSCDILALPVTVCLGF